MNTLYDYYNSKGQALPSVQQRAGVAQQAGISGYTGTAQQNTQLLGFLQNQGQPLNTNQALPQGNLNASALGGNTALPNGLPTGQNQVASPDAFVNSLTVPPPLANPNTNSVSSLENNQTGLMGRLQSSLSKLGTKGARELQLNNEQGITQKEQNIQNSYNEIIQKQQNYRDAAIQLAGNGGTQEALMGRQGRLRREEAIDIGGKTATLQVMQGNLQLAKDTIARTLDLEFKPIEQDIENTKTFLDLNFKFLDRADKKQAQAQQLALENQKMAMDDYKSYKKTLLDDAIKNNTSKVSAILQAGSMKDLSDIFGSSLNDPNAPVSEKVESLQNTLNLINNISDSDGLNSRVGPNALVRKFLAVRDAFGAGDAFAGSVHQLSSQETLNQLINLKAQGGTLGALSDQERIMLQNAATKINAWEKKDKNGNGTGVWDIRESDFKNELSRLKTLTNTALQRAGWIPSTLSGNDLQEINTLLQAPGNFMPVNYYQ